MIFKHKKFNLLSFQLNTVLVGFNVWMMYFQNIYNNHFAIHSTMNMKTSQIELTEGVCMK